MPESSSNQSRPSSLPAVSSKSIDSSYARGSDKPQQGERVAEVVTQGLKSKRDERVSTSPAVDHRAVSDQYELDSLCSLPSDLFKPRIFSNEPTKKAQFESTITQFLDLKSVLALGQVNKKFHDEHLTQFNGIETLIKTVETAIEENIANLGIEVAALGLAKLALLFHQHGSNAEAHKFFEKIDSLIEKHRTHFPISSLRSIFLMKAKVGLVESAKKTASLYFSINDYFDLMIDMAEIEYGKQKNRDNSVIDDLLDEANKTLKIIKQSREPVNTMHFTYNNDDALFIERADKLIDTHAKLGIGVWFNKAKQVASLLTTEKKIQAISRICSAALKGNKESDKEKATSLLTALYDDQKLFQIGMEAKQVAIAQERGGFSYWADQYLSYMEWKPGSKAYFKEALAEIAMIRSKNGNLGEAVALIEPLTQSIQNGPDPADLRNEVIFHCSYVLARGG